MIDRSIFDPKRLLDTLLDDCAGNRNVWWRRCEIVRVADCTHSNGATIQSKRHPDSWCVRCDESYLRMLRGNHAIWDIFYGEDSEFSTPEYALLALLTAPVPPQLLKSICWSTT